MGALLVGHLMLSSSWLVALLSSKVFVWVGQRSYSMYLLHMMLIDTVEHFLAHRSVFTTLLVAIISIACTALAADVLFRFVEEPARQFGKRLLIRTGHTSSSLTPKVAADMIADDLIRAPR
jgi:peptidoglycan/LPS O-acetylase OafA/YrhL